MRIRFVWIGILASASLPVAVAPAANQAVTASSNVFTPADVTVLQGESVTWTNGDGFHNVRFEDGLFTMPTSTDPPPWSVSRTFNTVGKYRYYCEAHGQPNGVGMSGTVTVEAAGTNPPPPPVSADKIAPALKLGGQSRQKVLRRRAVFVAVEVNEASTVVARGTVTVPGGRKVRTKKTSRKLAVGEKATLKLRFSSQALRKLRRAFVKRKRLTARVTVTARDAAGNVRSAKRRIGLRGNASRFKVGI